MTPGRPRPWPGPARGSSGCGAPLPSGGVQGGFVFVRVAPRWLAGAHQAERDTERPRTPGARPLGAGGPGPCSAGDPGRTGGRGEPVAGEGESGQAVTAGELWPPLRKPSAQKRGRVRAPLGGARARPCAVITQRRPAPCGARGAQRPPPREPDTGSGLLRVAAESRRDLDQRPQLRGAGVPGLGRAAADWAPAGLPTPLSGAPQRLAGRSPRSLGSARLESWAVLTGRKGRPLLWG